MRKMRRGWATGVAMACLVLAGCGTNVKGHTYAAPDGSVTIVFQSGGVANMTMGPIPVTCTYTQSGKQVNLTCGGQTEVLTLGSNGALDGPQETIGHLTKVK
ncbi:MAG TPA: hypothetical protein VMT38_00195 [Terracidiphilus sp.]|nr:hypothetical protein [Terracidiphilus sp.]